MADPTDTPYLDDPQLLVGPMLYPGNAQTVRSGAKRAFDAITAGTVLLIISPIMLMIWIAVRFDGGPGFYGHRRVGHGGREFRCLKFRSMVTNADEVLRALLARDPAAREEWEKSRKLLRDPRVTRVGRFLRATSLDELPQLFNVLRGDMSLVGPRPVVRAEIDKFYHGTDREAYFSVRPGVTGLWQVSGRSDASYDQRVRLDCEYVMRASFAFDMLILCKTVAVVLKRRGAY